MNKLPTMLFDCTHDINYYLLVIIVFIDILAGIVCAIKDKRVNSTIAYYGIAKAVFTLIVPILVYPFFELAQQPNFNIAILYAFMYPYSASLIENVTRLGFKVPNMITDFFDQNKFRK